MSLLKSETIVNDKKWLLVPVETKSRELDGKVLFALEAAQNGWAVILGRGIRGKGYLPKGLFVENSIAPGRSPDIKNNLKIGTKTIAWCEEGLVYLSPEEYSRRRVEPESYELIEKYFAWGNQQAQDMIDEAKCDPQKITVSGNPRFDILRKDLRKILDYRVNKIKSRYGKIILVNTRFALYSNYRGADFFFQKMKQRGKLRTPEQEAKQIEYQNFQRDTFFAFQDAVKALSTKYPDYTIVVRPHPSESHDPWLELSKKHKNIIVVFEGNVAEWILASDICLHNNCTTGVEAYLLDKNTLSYRPLKDERFDTELPHALSDETDTIDGLLSWIDNTLKGEETTSAEKLQKRTEVSKQHVAGQEGESASQAIVKQLDELSIEQTSLNHTRNKIDSIIECLKSILRPIKRCFYTKEQANKARYTKQKFDQVTLKEMNEFINNTCKVTGNYQDLAIHELEPNIFCIYKKER